MKTEEEARQCWCPFARLGFEGAIEDVTFAYAANRWADAGAMKSCNCIASECMAWRWDEAESARLNVEWSAREPMKATPAEHEKIHGPCPEKIGHCGLAGKP